MMVLIDSSTLEGLVKDNKEMSLKLAASKMPPIPIDVLLMFKGWKEVECHESMTSYSTPVGRMIIRHPWCSKIRASINAIRALADTLP